MQIILGKNNGFCSGVKKAVETAYEHGAEGVYILGNLINNERVVANIEKTGAKTVNDVTQIPNGSKVLIRSHGVGKAIYDKLNEKGVTVIDCTCSFVKRIQKIVSEHYKQGFAVVIVGEGAHPEVTGINGWCDNKGIITDGESIDYSLIWQEKVCIVAQTTFSYEKFAYFLKKFNKSRYKTVEIFNTICYTTRERQTEAVNLSKICDCMLVVGSASSSNTRKLLNLCREHCNNVFLVEQANLSKIKNLVSFKKLGIVSGASTPTEQSMEVFFSMEKNTEAEVLVNEVAEGTNEVAEVAAPAEEVVNVDVSKPAETMEEAVAKMDEKQTKFRKGQKITATISSATDEGLAVYISNTKKEILLPKEEINCETYEKAAYAAKVGEEIQVKIVGLNPVQLSEKAIAKEIEDEKLIAEIADGTKEFSVAIDGFNKGGLIGHYAGFEVFVPSSQIRIGFVKDLGKYVGKTLRLKAEKIENGRRKQIVASQRVILEAEKAAKDAERAAKEEEFFSAVSVGDVIMGTAVRFASFGAFIDVAGIDCLAHISDLSWTGCNSPAEVLEIGKQYEFKVLKCEKETKKVSLGYKQLQPRPWDLVPGKYMVGDVVTGKVVRIVPFGAFVELEKGIDGLVHVSQISHEWLENPTSALKVGEEVEAKIIAIDHEKEKITLSIKAMTPAPEVQAKPKKEKVEGEEEGEKPARKPRRQRNEENDGEMREWKDSNDTGVSIAELLANNNK
ncbi:MAG: 4-hydroxy-3-methylbut-2-enyl diphosphate reductase [Clostridia bacterium]|nr:4-hydroxy-3-methylbut-2-enyl diphosphate reductase [Clostridia bacterium]